MDKKKTKNNKNIKKNISSKNIKNTFKLFIILLLLGIFLIIVGFLMRGKIDYNAVYKKGNITIKTYLKEKIIYYKVEGNGIFVKGESILEDNKVALKMISGNTYLIFKEERIVIKTDSITLKSGSYKKTDEYNKKEFIQDFTGEQTFLKSDFNGIYKNDEKTIYGYQKTKNSIRIRFTYNNLLADLVLEKKEDETYYLKLYDDEYTLKILNNSMTLSINTKDSYLKEYEDTYQKEDIIDEESIVNYFN